MLIKLKNLIFPTTITIIVVFGGDFSVPKIINECPVIEESSNFLDCKNYLD